MPAEYRFDFDYHLVISIARGVLTMQEMLDHQNGLRNDPLFKPSMNQLLDFGSVSVLQIQGSDVRSLAVATLFSATSRRAFLVDERDLFFGLARMYEQLRARGPEQIHVFREYAEARDWLGLPAAYPRPA